MTPSEKAVKIQQALELGFITRSWDDKGVVHYELTDRGFMAWKMEVEFKKVFGESLKNGPTSAT